MLLWHMEIAAGGRQLWRTRPGGVDKAHMLGRVAAVGPEDGERRWGWTCHRIAADTRAVNERWMPFPGPVRRDGNGARWVGRRSVQGRIYVNFEGSRLCMGTQDAGRCNI